VCAARLRDSVGNGGEHLRSLSPAYSHGRYARESGCGECGGSPVRLTIL